MVCNFQLITIIPRLHRQLMQAYRMHALPSETSCVLLLVVCMSRDTSLSPSGGAERHMIASVARARLHGFASCAGNPIMIFFFLSRHPSFSSSSYQSDTAAQTGRHRNARKKMFYYRVHQSTVSSNHHHLLLSDFHPARRRWDSVHSPDPSSRYAWRFYHVADPRSFGALQSSTLSSQLTPPPLHW